MSLPQWSQAQILNQLNTGNMWYGQVISYAFPTSSSATYGDAQRTGFSPLTQAQQTYAKLAVSLWDDLIAPDFVSTANNSDVEFALTTTGINYAIAYYPAQGAVWFNKNESSLTAPVIGEHGFVSYVHETGHALGLDHMGAYNGVGTWTPSCFQDSTVYTVMSYFGPDWQNGVNDVAWADWTGTDGLTYSPQTPMINDILAIQKIYGAETTTRTTATIYGFNSNISGETAKIYDFSINRHPILTLYDSGGEDTLDLSGYTIPSSVNLSSGESTSCNDMTKNIWIERASKIENAITGIANDIILGNSINNLIKAGGGNDNVDGGFGRDSCIYLGKASDYTFRLDETAQSVIITDKTQNRDGIDALKSVELVKFSDGTKSLASLAPLKIISGSSNSDTLNNPAKNISFDGLSGYDTVVFSASKDNFVCIKDGNTISVYDSDPSRYGMDYFTNIEKLKFADGSLLQDVSSDTQAIQIYRLYQAAFARTPDEAGFTYWRDIYQKTQINLEAIANEFVKSEEFIKKYGANISSAEYVGQLYRNVLGREGDSGGIQFWNDQLINNKQSRDQVLIGFANSPENIDLIGINSQDGYWVT
jgi:serralysin